MYENAFISWNWSLEDYHHKAIAYKYLSDHVGNSKIPAVFPTEFGILIETKSMHGAI